MMASEYLKLKVGVDDYHRSFIRERNEAFVGTDKDAIAIGDLYQRARMSVVESVRYLIEAGHRLIKNFAATLDATSRLYMSALNLRAATLPSVHVS